MNTQLINEYDELVPADQLIIDAMILSLRTKDKQIRDLLKEVTNFLGRIATENSNTENLENFR